MTAGRAEDNTIRIDSERASRQHARFEPSAEGYVVVDLDTRNGTYLNGLRVNTAPLYDGDKIQIGSNTVLKFSIQDQLEEQYQRSIYESATRDGLTR